MSRGRKALSPASKWAAPNPLLVALFLLAEAWLPLAAYLLHRGPTCGSFLEIKISRTTVAWSERTETT